MDISTRIGDDGVITLTIAGEVDVAVADDLRDIGLGLLSSSECRTLVLDFGAVTFLDSTGIGALVALRNAAMASGHDLSVWRPSEPVSRILTLTGLDDVFGLRPAAGARG